TLSGSGMGLTQSGSLMGTGALQNIAAVNSTWTGNITLNSNTAISNTQANNPLTLTGIISGAANLVKLGAGTVVLGAAESYTGNPNIMVGTLSLAGSGSLTGTPGTQTTAGIMVSVNASLTLDNTGTNLADRLGDAIPITLFGGTLNYQGSNTAGVASTETV